MAYNPDFHHRRSIRLKGYDYSQSGAYFCTMCIEKRQCLLGEVQDGSMMLNAAGEMVAAHWIEMETRFPSIMLDEWVVMPNHFHAIVVVETAREPLSAVIGAFKSITTHAYIEKVKAGVFPPFYHRLWQRDYFERIIRGERELLETRRYIVENPQNWPDDRNNPDHIA